MDMWTLVFFLTILAACSSESVNSTADSYNCTSDNPNYDSCSRLSIVNHLLNSSNYDSYTIPEFDTNDPINVTVQIIFNDIHEISETSMDYSVDVYVHQWWIDPRLNFTSQYIKVLELDPKKNDMVWQPDTFFPHEKKATLHTLTTVNHLVYIMNDGKVLSSQRLAMTLSCKLDFHFYPFDEQRCPFKIRSYSYTTNHIKYVWLKNDSTHPFKIGNSELPQFRLVSTKDNVELRTYEKTVEFGSFSTLVAVLRLKREIGYYFIQVFLPSVLLVGISWISFWVDPNAVHARLGVGVTCVLTLTTQSSGVQQTLPPTYYVKAIDVWMFICLVFVFAALLEFAYVNVLMRRGPSQPNVDEEEEDKEDKESTSVVDSRKLAARVDFISRIAFPGAFVLFVVIYAFGYAFTPQKLPGIYDTSRL